MTTTTQHAFLTLVRAADKDFDKERLRPWVYEFSSGRRFEDKPDPYATSTST